MGLANPAPPRDVVVDDALWSDLRVQSGFWTAPWADGGPTEADLVERVVGMATPRPASVNGDALLAASVAVMRRPYVVDVCVHHRGRSPAATADVAVTLLRTALPADPAAWAAAAAPDVAGLAAALDGLPADTQAGAAPNALPGWVPPAPWAFGDAARPARRPRTETTPGQASIVSFDADFGTVGAGTDLLLLAVVHHRAEPITLRAGGIRAGVLGSSHAAARSVRAVG